MTQVKVDKPVKNYLMDFGLTEKEVKLYLALLKTGPNTIMNLARETGIKRSTTHNNIEELIKKGLVSQTNYGERRMVVAEDPGKLSFLLEQKKWDMKKLEDNMGDIVSMIKETVPESEKNSSVEVKYYEGKPNIQVIYKEAFNSNDLRSFVNLAATSKIFPENKEIFNEAHKKNRELKVREIVENSDESLVLAETYKSNPNFQFKATKQSLNLSNVNTLIYDNKIALINLKENLTATVIKNTEYYEVMKQIFDLLWGSI